MLKTIGKHLRKAALSAKLFEELSKRIDQFHKENPDFAITLPTRIQVQFETDWCGGYDVGLRWDGSGIVLTIDYLRARSLPTYRINQMFTVLVWFLRAGPDAEYITFNNSDGEVASCARFTPPSLSQHIIPLTDEYAARAATLDWADRTDDFVWRGGTLGTGVWNPTRELVDHPGVIQRIRLAHMAKGTDLDFKFVPTNATTAKIWEPVKRAGLAGERVEEPTWLTRKYAIDIDGMTNTWSNLIIRMHYGCCVLKVASQYGYRQWYYDKLVPYEHFVPVKADMSDMFEKMDWVRNNQSQANQSNCQSWSRCRVTDDF